MRKQSIRWISTFILLFALLFPQMSSVMATETGRTVRVAAGINNALYLDENGQPAGYCANYLKQIAWQEDWTLEYVEGSWNESVERLENGEIDLLLPTQMTEERKSTMGFPDYISGYQPIALFAKEDSHICYNDYQSMDQARVALSAGTSNSSELVEFAEQYGFNYTSVEYNTTQEKMEALEKGDVDLIVFSSFNEVPNGKIVAVIDYLPFYFTTRIDNTELLSELNEGMKNVIACCPDMMENMYSASIESVSQIAYTKAEEAAKKNTQKLVCGVYEDSLPLAGKDEEGNPIGIYVDFVNEIEKNSGIPIEVEVVSRDVNIYDYMEEGKLDFIISTKSLARTASDTSKILASGSITDYSSVTVTKAGYSMENAQKPRFALTKARTYLEAGLKETYPDCEITYYQNTKDCLIAIEDDEADATMINTWEFNYQIKNARFENLIEWENMRENAELIVGTTTSLDSDVLSVIDKAINQISQSTIDEIITKNVNLKYISYDRSDKLYEMRDTIIIVVIIMFAIMLLFSVFWFMKYENEKKLRAKNRELEIANKSKTDFLSRMSHELRTPINAISGYSDIQEDIVLSKQTDKEVMLHSIHATKRATNYLLAIIRDLLDVQNIEAGKIELKNIEVNAADYMNDVVEMISKEAKEKNIEFIYERLTHFSEGYILDGVRLQQILLNILHNAMKFTPEGGTVKMTAGAIGKDEKYTKLQFVISDNGIGMSKEFVSEKLFQNFTQENTDITSPYDGCGTGMAITKQLVELMGGEISCVSEKGKGTTFSFTIPGEHTKKKRRTVNKERPNYDLSGIRILLCEDNPMNQDMEKRLLEKMQCEVEIANDGQIGLEKFGESGINHYSVVLMDIRMPNMDGLEATRQIRALDRIDAKTVPILAVSANAFDEDVKESLAAGMNEHLAKPVDAKSLYKKIIQYCRE